jgi:hypothetical protein
LEFVFGVNAPIVDAGKGILASVYAVEYPTVEGGRGYLASEYGVIGDASLKLWWYRGGVVKVSNPEEGVSSVSYPPSCERLRKDASGITGGSAWVVNVPGVFR